MKYCTNCGNKLASQADVCLVCGRIVKQQNQKFKKKKGFFWILSLVFACISFFSLIGCFFASEFYFLSFPMMILAILFGILGFFEKSKLNLIGLFLGIFVFLCMMILFIIGLVEIFDDSMDGNWILSDDSVFQITGQDDICYWNFDADYYQGICSYEKALISEKEVPNYDDNTFVLYMQIETVKYNGQIYEASDYLETEFPYFKFYVYLNENHEIGEFYNPTSGTTRNAYKQEMHLSE